VIRSLNDIDRGVGFQVSGLADAGAPGRPAVAVHGIVLAGIHAWGGCVLDEVVCRPFVPVAGRPVICHTLGWLRKQGISAASVCANSDTASLRRCLGDGQGLDLSLDYYEDVMPRGPAGSVRDAGAGRAAGRLVVVEGTIVPRIELAGVLRAHEESKALLTVVATQVGTSNGHSKAVLRPAGIYIFSPGVLEYIPARGYQDIKETLVPRLHAHGKGVGTYVVDGEAIGRVADARSYMSVSKWVVEQIAQEAVVPEGYVRMGEGRVHESVRMAVTAQLIGPVIVEPGCVIEDDVIIIGPTTIGEGSVIRRGAVISRSIVWSLCTIGPGVMLDHCVVTDHSAINGASAVRDTVWVSSRRGWSGFLRRARSGLGPAKGGGYAPASAGPDRAVPGGAGGPIGVGPLPVPAAVMRGSGRVA